MTGTLRCPLLQSYLPFSSAAYPLLARRRRLWQADGYPAFLVTDRADVTADPKTFALSEEPISAMSTLPLEIDLLGPLRVRHEGRTITRFQTHKTAVLLGLMAARPQRPHRREEVIEMLWPDVEVKSGRNRLRLALSDLRRALEAPTKPAVTSHRLVVADRLQISLDAEKFTTDKARFEVLLEQSRKTEDDAQRIAWLTQAIELYRGDLLLGFDESWIMGERQQIADAYLLALRRLIKSLAKTHQYERALLYAQRAVQADPLREEAHRTLMQLYAAMGRPADTLRQYRQMEAQLSEDLNAVPSSASKLLYAQLLHSASVTLPQPVVTPVLVSGPLVSPADQTTSATRPVTPSDTVKTSSPPNSLPVYGTSLLGRQTEVAQVGEMLLTPDTHLVTITGLGGCGKTRVAVGAGQALRMAFGGNVWFVPLAAVRDASLLWEIVANVLDLPSKPALLRQRQVVEAFGRSPGLLVLDNCEHLGDAASRWIADLLQAAPVLTCLATSRQRLNVSSEYEYGLSPLPTPLAAASLPEVMACPSAQLFVDRARRVRPAFEVTPTNAPVLASLCRRLEGLPLALELAAVWTQTLTLSQIQARLAQRFTLLVSRYCDAPDRHRSLRAVLDSSFQMLLPAVQRFFVQLSAFQHGWTLDAAQSVCAEPDALAYLTKLREHSLLTADDTGEQMRYVWLETVREYACECLPAEERDALWQRHATFYADLAERAREPLHGEKAVATLALLDADQANCRAALTWGMAHPPLGAQLANSLARFWHIRGHTQEGTAWFLQALADPQSLPLDVRLNTTGNAGNFAYLNADYVRARAYYEACLEMATQAGDDYGIAHALDSLGNVDQELGDCTQARRLMEESILRWRQLEAPYYLALALSHRAGLADEEGEYTTARHLYEESLTLYRQVGKHQGIALVLSNLAGVLLKGKDYTDAAPLLQESLTLSYQIGSPRTLAYGLAQLTRLAVRSGCFAQAAQVLGMLDKVREDSRVIFHPITVAEEQEVENRLCQELGGPVFQELRQQGHTLSQEIIFQENFSNILSRT